MLEGEYFGWRCHSAYKLRRILDPYEMLSIPLFDVHDDLIYEECDCPELSRTLFLPYAADFTLRYYNRLGVDAR